jgi:nucleotide-binding universal stress UspA family protein
MFKNILVPTDGSALSRKAAKQAVALAKAVRGRITALHVAPPYNMYITEDYVPVNYTFRKDYVATTKKAAQQYLSAVQKMARAAGVRCQGVYVTDDFPAQAIVRAARRYKCNAILMASHGRRGLNKVLLGSETQKVLASAKVPVIVVR